MLFLSTLTHYRVERGKEEETPTENLCELSSQEISDIVEDTYIKFFSAKSKCAAAGKPSAKLSNLLLRLADFSTIVEADSAMKAGDIGRVMNVWKRWSIIAQGVKTLTQYLVHLPWMIILLNHVLPPGLRKVILHSLFVAPTGGRRHFLAKDHFLEMQNYWLKYFFNHGGQGTNIDSLKDVYSVNVTLVHLIFFFSTFLRKFSVFSYKRFVHK